MGKSKSHRDSDEPGKDTIRLATKQAEQFLVMGLCFIDSYSVGLYKQCSVVTTETEPLRAKQQQSEAESGSEAASGADKGRVR